MTQVTIPLGAFRSALVLCFLFGAACMLSGCQYVSSSGQPSAGGDIRLERIAQLAGGPGEAVAVLGTMAYFGDGTSLVAVDVADPTTPRRSVALAMPDIPVDIAAAPGRVVVAAGEAGLIVVDVTDPLRPVVAGSWQGPGPATQVVLSEDWAIVLTGEVDVYASDGDSVLSVVDLADPNVPRLLGQAAVPGKTEDLAVVEDRVYVAATRGQDTLLAYQLSGQGQLSTLDSLRLSFCGGCQPRIAAMGDHMAVASTDEETGLQVVDVSDARQMTIVGSEPLPGGPNVSDIAIVETRAYVLCNGSLCVGDLGDWSRPRLIHRNDEVWGKRLAPNGGGLVVVGPERLQVVSTPKDEVPGVVGSMDRFRIGDGQIRFIDDRLLVTDRSTVWLYDTADPGLPQPVAHVSLVTDADLVEMQVPVSALTVRDHLAFLGLEIGLAVVPMR